VEILRQAQNDIERIRDRHVAHAPRDDMQLSTQDCLSYFSSMVMLSIRTSFTGDEPSTGTSSIFCTTSNPPVT